MTPVQKHILRRFTVLYGRPNTAGEEEFLAEYTRALGGVEDSRLMAASDLIVREHKFLCWPTVAECLGALRRVLFERQREAELRGYQTQPRETRRAPTEASKVLVAGMVAKLKADMAALDDSRRIKRALPPPTDRERWATRQCGLLDAGKWCFSVLFPPREAA